MSQFFFFFFFCHNSLTEHFRVLCWTACKHCYSKCRDKEHIARGEKRISDYQTPNLGNMNRWDCLQTLFLNQSMVIEWESLSDYCNYRKWNEKNDVFSFVLSSKIYITLMLLMGQISNSIWVDILQNTYCGLMSQDIQVSKAQTTHVLKTYIIDIWWDGGKIGQIHKIIQGRTKNSTTGFQSTRSRRFLSLEEEWKLEDFVDEMRLIWVLKNSNPTLPSPTEDQVLAGRVGGQSGRWTSLSTLIQIS